MKALTIGLIGTALLVFSGEARADSRSERCESYAHDAMRSTPTSTGVGRGAARGAVVGAVAGNAGAGAATGAVVGSVRKSSQKNKSYKFYYDECMRR